MSRARCQIARHIVKYTSPHAVGNIMFFSPVRIVRIFALPSLYARVHIQFLAFHFLFFIYLFIHSLVYLFLFFFNLFALYSYYSLYAKSFLANYTMI